MRRRLRYAITGVAALGKPFLLGLAGVVFGMTGSGGGGAILKYLLLPQAIPAICLGFLYFDERKYSVYRPLALVIEAGSLALLAAAGAQAAVAPSRFILASGDGPALVSGAIAAALVALIDACIILVLLSGAIRAGANGALEESEKETP